MAGGTGLDSVGDERAGLAEGCIRTGATRGR
jgi:hypothetical protein